MEQHLINAANAQGWNQADTGVLVGLFSARKGDFYLDTKKEEALTTGEERVTRAKAKEHKEPTRI